MCPASSLIIPRNRYAVASAPEEALTSWLLDNGADPNARCDIDITPLSTAVECAPLSIVQQPFAHFPRSTAFRGQLLHCAARRASDDADTVLQLVLDRCQLAMKKILYADDAFSYEVRKVVGLGTALHEAARAGQPSVAQILLQNGADVSILDSHGHTALEAAQPHDNHAMVALLRAAGNGLSAKM